MAVKDSGADMQPEFDRSQRQRVPYYEPVASAGWVQDQIRGEEPWEAARADRQTLGDPKVYSNKASASTANTPVKPVAEK